MAQRENYSGRSVSRLMVMVAAVAVLGVTVVPGWATVVKFQPDGVDNTIVRDGHVVPMPLFDSKAIPGSSAPYNYIEEVYDNKAIAHSGAAVNNPQLYQHVFGYSLPNSETHYATDNVTGHTRTLLITPEEAGRPDGTFVLAKSNVVLDGLMLIAKGPQEGSTYKGLQASFDVEVTYDFDFWGLIDRTIKLPIFRGSVKMFSLPNGIPFFYTTGNINRILHVSSIDKSDDMYRINFDQVKIPYRLLARVGHDYTITTKITSHIVTQGEGTGAEVLFGPGEPNLPTFIEEHEVPEPATMLLLAGGSLGVILPKFRRKK